MDNNLEKSKEYNAKYREANRVKIREKDNLRNKSNAKKNSKALIEINKVISAVVIMKHYNCEFFDEINFNTNGFNNLIKDICVKHNVNEDTIRKIGDFN